MTDKGASADMRKTSLFAVLLALLAPPEAPAQSQAPAAVVSVSAEQTQFRLTLGDGRIMRSPELVGAKLIVATETGPVKVQIAAVERDPGAKSGDVWLHTLLVENPDGTSQNMCEAGPDGRRQGFPIASRLRPDGGTENTPPEQFDVVCSAGARAKCVRFGYRPWVPAEEDLYNACTRMVRADYGGKGLGTTRNGMSIDIFDDLGIQKADNAANQDFEAGWTAQGAVCVRHVRVKENTSLTALEAAFPHLKGRIGEVCTETNARTWGAILFNRSVP
jgi:hypothetical protein